MYRKTFEIIAKYIAKENKTTLAFDTDGEAYADMENNVLHLPQDIADENALSALALTMHEAAHIRHSKEIPIKQIAPAQSDFHILNAIEDIRIDCKNFRVLPNVYEFYAEMVKKHIDLTTGQVPNEAVVRLCAGILEAEGFSPKITQKDRDFLRKSNLTDIMRRGTQEIEVKDWNRVKATIQEIKKLLNIDPKKDKPNKAKFINGDPDGNDQQPQANGKDKNGKTSGAADQQDPTDLSGISQILRPSSVWGKGKKMPGGSSLSTTPLAMDELCTNQFKEILNVKEIKVINEGVSLDTNNLLDFYTGDIEPLFKQDKNIRKKKSKVMFLLDASGSMQTRMLDNKQRGHVVKAAVQKLTEILDEVHQLEGLNVDWCISQFDDSYTPLTKENWQTRYITNRGTNFITGFTGAMEDMLSDYTIEGKRIIVAFSDGDIGNNEIDYVSDLIRKNHSDVRMLIIGVGSNMSGKFVQDIVGNNVIVSHDNAIEIIMETIKEML